MIENGMTLDREAKVIRVHYPLIRDPALLSDNRRQVISMCKGLEARLKKQEHLAAYNKEMQSFLDRGVIRELTKEEMDVWRGPVNYVLHHGVPKPGSTTTPLRVVSNSSLNNNDSGHSYNSILAKGPNALTLLLQVLVTFRSYTNVVVWDLHKAYNCMYTGDDEMHCRRFVWRWGYDNSEWRTYAFVRVHFGDRPAAVCMEKSRLIAIEAGKDIDPELVERMNKGGYVNDNVNGGTEAEIDKMVGEITEKDGEFFYSGTVARVFDLIGMRPKVMVRSGEQDPRFLDKLGGSVLGYRWSAKEDEIVMKIVANISPKKYGVRLEDDLDSCNLEKLQNRTLTLRRVMGIVCSVYDPLGLISPITLKLKILLKETHKIPKLKWDDALPREMQLRWVEAIKDIVNMQEIRISRSEISTEYSVAEIRKF